MRRFSPAFSAMISVATLLTGCFDDEIVLPEPPVEEGPRLEEGVYEVQVAAVDALDCYGARERDIVGQSLLVELSHRRGDRVVLDWDGMQLKGEMAGGSLSASGEQVLWYDTTVAEPEEDGDQPVGSEDDPDGGDTGAPDSGDSGGSGGSDPDTGAPDSGDSGGSTDPDPGSGGGSTDPDSGSGGGSTDPDSGSGGSTGSTGADDAPDMWMSLSLELSVRTGQIADGRFHYVMESGGERCEVEAEVGVIRVGKRQREPQPVYEDTDTDTDTAEPGSDTDAG